MPGLTMPRDDANQTVAQVVRLLTNRTISSITSGTAKPTLSVLNSKVARIYASQDMYFAQGPAGTVANSSSPVIPGGSVEYFSTAPGLDIFSFLAVSTTGFVTVTECG